LGYGNSKVVKFESSDLEIGVMIMSATIDTGTESGAKSQRVRWYLFCNSRTSRARARVHKHSNSRSRHLQDHGPVRIRCQRMPAVLPCKQVSKCRARATL